MAISGDVLTLLFALITFLTADDEALGVLGTLGKTLLPSLTHSLVSRCLCNRKFLWEYIYRYKFGINKPSVKLIADDEYSN